jgi:hypothetical protein
MTKAAPTFAAAITLPAKVGPMARAGTDAPNGPSCANSSQPPGGSPRH